MAIDDTATTFTQQIIQSLPPSVIFISMHIVVETPAGLNFILRPSYTLSSPSRDAHSVIRQYGLLLLVLNGLLSLLLIDFCRETFLVKAFGNARGPMSMPERSYITEQIMDKICGILFLYHIAPFWRAIASRRDPQSRSTTAYGSSWVVAVVHGTIGAGLLSVWLRS